jgi:hypothetical protein
MISHDLASLDEASSRQDQSFQLNPPPSPDVQKQLADLQRQSLEGREKVRGGLARRQSTLDRLQSHLLLRFMNLDPFALALATQRGEADLQELRDMSTAVGTNAGYPTRSEGRVRTTRRKLVLPPARIRIFWLDSRHAPSRLGCRSSRNDRGAACAPPRASPLGPRIAAHWPRVGRAGSGSPSSSPARLTSEHVEPTLAAY